MKRAQRCEKHQNYKYMNFWPFCRVTEERDQLRAENERLKQDSYAMIRQRDETIERLRAALKRECCCPGEISYTTGKEILCDACETLAALTKEPK